MSNASSPEHLTTPTLWTLVEAIILSVICLISLFGNISLFIIVFRSRVLRTTSNWFTLNLAIADIMVSAINMPVTVYTIIQGKWLFGESACRALAFLNITSFIASVMSLALIAINRFFYVVHWKNYSRYFTKYRIMLFIMFDWALSILLSSPPLLGWSGFDYIPGKSYCFVFWPADVYFMYFMIIVCFFGPLITMAVCYTKILLFTRNAKRKIYNSKGIAPVFYPRMQNHSLHRSISPEESKITNTLLTVLAAFLLCWTTFAITMFFDVYHPSPLPRAVDVGSLLLGYLNSCCNPIIYSVRNRKMRTAFIKLYSMCVPCLNTRRRLMAHPQGDTSIGRPSVITCSVG